MNEKIFFKRSVLITIIAFLLFSCSQAKQGDLLEIPIDIDQNSSLPLSEITEEITAIELEFTDESLISTNYIQRIIISGNDVIIAQLNNILLFNKDGKFVRSISSRGQGPGEYNYISNLAWDEKNKLLFILSNSPAKIICYDLDGKFKKETFIKHSAFFRDINFVNNELLLVGYSNTDGKVLNSVVYRWNKEFQVIDSFTIRSTYLGDYTAFSNTSIYNDFITNTNSNSTIYLYCSNNIFLLGPNSAKIILPDTLYQIKNNQYFPEIKLKFKNDGINNEGEKFIDLHSIYRSSKYIFALYENKQNNNGYRYHFCYDTKTGKGYNMQDGYTDDINKIETRVSIRPFNFNTEMFYYLHTHMKPDDLEEPNPTLYIGKLKK